MNGNNPPGPKGQFVLGSLPQFRRDMPGFFRHCAKEYGDLSSFRLAHERCCLINDPGLLETVFVQFKDRLRKPRRLGELKLALGEGLLTNEGKSWRERRRLMQPAFHRDRIRRYSETIVSRTGATIDRWQSGVELDVHDEMMRLSLEIVAECLFGFQVMPSAHVIGNALTRFMQQFEAMNERLVPLPMSAPTWGNLRARFAVNGARREITRLIARQRKEGAEVRNLLADLLAFQEATGLNDAQLVDEVVTLLTAGHETTAITLSWTLMLLSRHREVRNKLIAEITDRLGGAWPEFDDMEQLPYVRQVLTESMRLYPPVWWMGREALEDLELGGFMIPKGAQLLMSQLLLHRDPRFYDDPDTFRPERWTTQFSRQLPKFAYFPFGGGPRYCIGRNFAWMEITLMLTVICQQFRLDTVPDHPIEPQPSITLRPRFGIKMTPRRGNEPPRHGGRPLRPASPRGVVPGTPTRRFGQRNENSARGR